MQLAKRLENLGTETAFAVSEAAAAWKAQGHKIYPFHLGDINIPTPANIVAAQNQAIADGKTGYAPAAGIPPLRAAIAEVEGAHRGIHLTPENIAVQPGGKPVVTKLIQAVMEPGDEVLYPNPGYPIYESQIDYFRGVGLPYRFTETATGFQVDMDYLESLITPRTRILIYNNCQNPLGTESSAAEMEHIAELAIRHNLWVLSDEAYFDVRYSGATTSIARLPGMQERTVILYTFSKKYAMTGWRLGAAIGPKEVIQPIARLNTNDESCTTHFVQWAGVEALRGDQSAARANVEILRERRDVTVEILRQIDGIVVHKPESTFYLFPNVTGVMARLGYTTVAAFADAALKNTGVSFCTRMHFGRPIPGESGHYIRFAYSGIDTPEIREGLTHFRDWIDNTAKGGAA
ncbi:aminotransferase class I/II-fold pyridoxal phosphate-dependent enzyme [Caldilinea sp.]|uniref:pyridoxal phosphate-dependent aminotransferase n=1 Tax=Caldilinea sp. TaxID=2293560 RepID=UPI002C4766D5|nr:aminotransferase class I/II-fold pyridoxal phosphate-dependent enzyme [Caldilinea sp.]HRA64585.1 aminotransferase class I/II-fold pyridoxal phosphate-dependent enzyme [Caldilinea sp.]